MIRRIAHIFSWSLLVAAIAIGLAWAGHQHSRTECTGFEIITEGGGVDPLIEASDIRSAILSMTDTLVGKELGSIDFHLIHKVIKEIPYVRSTDIQSKIDGNIQVRVQLREALLRLQTKDGHSFYIDPEGYLMPIHPGHPARVLIASGNIRGGMDPKQMNAPHIDSLPAGGMIRELFEMAKFIHSRALLDKLIAQIWVSKRGKLEMSPLIGEYTIIFGGFEDMNEKFEKLVTYYEEGAGKAGWIDYRSIDLRYKNQVICSKR